MENLVLDEKDDLGSNVLKIIEFVKQVERERGLTDEEMVYKYTHGHCWVLATCVVETINRIFGEVKEVQEQSFAKFNTHWYVEVKTNEGEFYYDICGKKTKEEVEAYMDNLEGLVREAVRFRDFDVCEKYWLVDYIKEECKKYIFGSANIASV